MKKLAKPIYIIKLILGIILAIVVFANVLFIMKEYNNINKGNRIIEKINNYYTTYKRLPNEDDWRVLEKLLLISRTEGDGDEVFYYPMYHKINENEYSLSYIEGFDGPYLTYDSKEKKWSK